MFVLPLFALSQSLKGAHGRRIAENEPIGIGS
jgi:hypothetical protein